MTRPARHLGAYYTGDDIADAIASRTIVPFLLHGIVVNHGPALAAWWALPRDDPDRYLPAALRHGTDTPLPAVIATGLGDVKQRCPWDQPAPAPFALPTETWREHIVRRQRCQELRHRLRAGAVESVNDLITLNLDVTRFAQDAIARASPAVLLAFGMSLRHIAVLDPACGAGAFLLAALRVLAPLQEQCQERLNRAVDFRAIRRAIVARNLHGVDLDPAAVAACQRNLTEAVNGDAPAKRSAHIRIGNALLGSLRTRVRRAPCPPVQSRLDPPPSKNRFDWPTAFPQVMRRGGFDVIIGNPPFVEYRHVRSRYRLPPGEYETERVGALHAFFMEQATRLLQPQGRCGLIVPAGAMTLDEALPLRRVLLARYQTHWFSSYGIRPAKLFPGVDQRLCIHLAGPGEANAPELYTTRHQHWQAAERPQLFDLLSYQHSFICPGLDRIPQLGCPRSARIMAKLLERSDVPLGARLARAGSFRLHYHRSPRYWTRATDFAPHFRGPAGSRSLHHVRELSFALPEDGKAMGAILNSSLFLFWFLTVGNGRNVTGADVARFPVGEMTAGVRRRLATLFDHLMLDYEAHSFVRSRRDCEYQEFRPSRSKPIVDRIDGVLARHFAFTGEELDLIVNYERKYRCREPSASQKRCGSRPGPAG